MYIAQAITFPFTGITAFSVLRSRYHTAWVGFFFTVGIHFGLSKLLLIPSHKKEDALYERLFTKYRMEVMNPKHRGKKLTKGKSVSQINEEDPTSSNFDDLKALIQKNIK